jgi:hypothetical protein
MIRLLARVARFLPGAPLPLGERPAVRLPELPVPMLDGGILTCADLAAHFVELPGLLRQRQPDASDR